MRRRTSAWYHALKTWESSETVERNRGARTRRPPRDRTAAYPTSGVLHNVGTRTPSSEVIHILKHVFSVPPARYNSLEINTYRAIVLLQHNCLVRLPPRTEWRLRLPRYPLHREMSLDIMLLYPMSWPPARIVMCNDRGIRASRTRCWFPKRETTGVNATKNAVLRSQWC